MNMKEYKESYLLSMNDIMDWLIDYNGGRFEREYINEWNYQLLTVWEELEERKDFQQTDALLNFLLEEMVRLVEEKLYIDEGIGSSVAQLTYLRYIEECEYIAFDSYECRFIDMTEDKSPNDLLNKLKSLSIKNYRSTL